MPRWTIKQRPKNKVDPSLIPYFIPNTLALQQYLFARMIGNVVEAEKVWGSGIHYANGEVISGYKGYGKVESYEISVEEVDGVITQTWYMWKPQKSNPKPDGEHPPQSRGIHAESFSAADSTGHIPFPILPSVDSATYPPNIHSSTKIAAEVDEDEDEDEDGQGDDEHGEDDDSDDHDESTTTASIPVRSRPQAPALTTSDYTPEPDPAEQRKALNDFWSRNRATRLAAGAAAPGYPFGHAPRGTQAGEQEPTGATSADAAEVGITAEDRDRRLAILAEALKGGHEAETARAPLYAALAGLAAIKPVDDAKPTQSVKSSVKRTASQRADSDDDETKPAKIKRETY